VAAQLEAVEAVEGLVHGHALLVEVFEHFRMVSHLKNKPRLYLSGLPVE
jgi:hypothetical protein